MKVLWFSNTPANSDEYFNSSLKGTGGWLKSLDKYLQHEVDLNIAFYSNKKTNNFRYLASNYFPINRHNSWRKKIINKIKPEIIDKQDLAKYLDIISKVNPDIIHIHGSENPFGIIANYTEIPVVMSIQGNLTVYRHKYCSGIEKKYLKINQRFKTFSINMLFADSFLKKKKLFDKIQIREERNLKSIKYFIGRTAWDKRISQILSPGSNYFHNDEMLRDGFYLQKWGKKRSEKLILHTTNGNVFYKGFETLCLTLNLLNTLGIETEWRVAGIRKDDLIVDVVRKKLGYNFPQKGLYLLGNLSETKLIGKLLEADIYIMTSHIENSPNNLCEAMMLGIPSIATFVGGTGSLMEDGEDGILIQDGDPWSMAGAIMELQQDFSKAELYGNNARKKALLRHNKRTIISDLLKTYRTILDKEMI